MSCKTPTDANVEGAGGTTNYGDGASGRARAGDSSEPAGATKFARYALSPTQPVTKFAQQPQKHQIWGVSSAQGELFHAHTHDQAVLGELFHAPDAATCDVETNNTTATKKCTKTLVSSPQRRWQFQLAHLIGEQRRRRFHAKDLRHQQVPICRFLRRIARNSIEPTPQQNAETLKYQRIQFKS